MGWEGPLDVREQTHSTAKRHVATIAVYVEVGNCHGI